MSPRRLLMRVLLLLGSAGVSLGLSEWIWRRVAEADYRRRLEQFNSGLYESTPDEPWLYELHRNVDVVDGIRQSDGPPLQVRTRTNADGFRHHEAWPPRMDDDAVRILFHGDSYTFGLASQEGEAFPFQVEAELRRRGIDAVAINTGVPGYNSEQEAARLPSLLERFRPRVCVFAAERPRGIPIGRWLAQVALALGAHLGIAWVALDRLRAGMPRLVDVAAYDAGMLLRLFAREWLRGCLPLSLVAAALLLHSRVRAAALALHLALGAYLLLGFHATASLGNDGACLLPLVPAAALLVMRALGGRPVLVVLLLVLSATVAVMKNVVRADWAPFQTFVSGIEELTQGRPFVLVAGTGFDEAVLLREPSVEAIRVRQVGAGLARNAVELVTDLDRRLASGQRVFVSPEAETALLDLLFKARNEHAAAFLVEVVGRFDWRPVHKDGFRAKELVRR